CRISQRPWHGRYGRASPRAAPDAGPTVPAPDQITAAGNCNETGGESRIAPQYSFGRGNRAGRPPLVNELSAKRLGDLIARLSTMHPARIDLGLERMQRLLTRLDHPERRLPPVIHVAGTNGKGSTVAYLRAILEASGYRVHAFTSPYLVRLNECYRLGRVGGGVLVDDVELNAAFDACESANAGEPITLFEIETAAAFDLFARHPADAVLLEVGLGGRLDATNVIGRPAACVISSVGIDHIEFLGPTLRSSAAEKAGIIKRGVPVICAHQEDDALDEI